MPRHDLTTPHTASVSAQSGAAGAHTDRTPVVGSFSTGRRIDNRPEALDAWRVTTRTSEVAESVAQLLGGEVSHTPAQDRDGEPVEVLTTSTRVPIRLAGPGAVRFTMHRWGPHGRTHHCDGQAFLSPPKSVGSPCGCPTSMSERRARAKRYEGPQASTVITFRLDGLPELGRFRLDSGSWILAESLPSLHAALAKAPGESRWTLTLRFIRHVATSGAVFRFTVPSVTPLTQEFALAS